MGANSARSSEVQLGHGIMSGATSLAHTDLALPPSAPPSLGQGGEVGRSVGRGVSACCDSRMHCVLRMDAHTHHVPATQCCCSAGNPKGASSLRCHCIPRVPSTDTASSRAGVVGRVQSVTKASILQACIAPALTFALAPRMASAAHTRLHAPLCCDGIIATFTYHQCTIASTTQKLHWHACTRGHMHACALVVLLHSFTRWCGCAMGTSTGPNKLWHMYSCH